MNEEKNIVFIILITTALKLESISAEISNNYQYTYW